ncbi:protocatechuate 3,4-dioxygenase beta subunit [Roseivirga ehrenbergii]|uniref:Intradiol ring-cleavage dioxygenase n=1 Tax=Roseivirga ehrenbergii (strain DSM 102268 / JCM 13514 / KCTC 12282 / NCIMB 14502 / KMM 6017) TaxID=279360 RepID=A0A150WZ61_ROSEK|nr:intradiol ring-cleavage dioxygenase [Roseivirga ehrenbergii]KYG71775.1 intradiol ring-cleavage dioxygenase [Roseivirga ehrenbergii]TCL07528.1 protocatechuate 3,4-dioxygenase beta subunit [Roseivirga ehrenbergii]
MLRKLYYHPILLITFLFNCKAQSHQRIGGPFENAEFMYIGMPKHIPSIDTSPGWMEEGQKLLITGTIYKKDGVTPAPNVIVYYYQTDTKGAYANRKYLDQKVARHGYIRSWVKSDENGKYAIYTVRPAAYPNRDDPAHIHPSIKEPNDINEYYIDAFVFDDDPLLTSEKRKAMENRGGSGVLRLLQKGDLQIAEHNIILGLNIPNYPVANNKQEASSGRNIGEDVISFTPYHAWGPDRGTKTCPICKYGRYQGVLYFVGKNTNWEEVSKWLIYLERESFERQKYLKVYFVYGNELNESNHKLITHLENIGRTLNLQKIALTFVPSFSGKASEIDMNKINPEVENTFIIYKQSNIVAKFINLTPTQKNLSLFSKKLDDTKGDFFHINR